MAKAGEREAYATLYEFVPASGKKRLCRHVAICRAPKAKKYVKQTAVLARLVAAARAVSSLRRREMPY